MKKIMLLIIFAMVLSLPNTAVSFADEQEYVKVIFPSAIIFEEATINSNVLGSLSYGKKLKLLDTNIYKQENGLEFYLVEINIDSHTQGYILCSHALNVKNSSPSVNLETNATINKECNIYVITGNDIVKSENTLASRQAIRVLKKEEFYTQIQYIDTYGEVATAYVLNEDVKLNGAPASTVGAILIIISTVSLVLVLFGVKTKRKKK